MNTPVRSKEGSFLQRWVGSDWAISRRDFGKFASEGRDLGALSVGGVKRSKVENSVINRTSPLSTQEIRWTYTSERWGLAYFCRFASVSLRTGSTIKQMCGCASIITYIKDHLATVYFVGNLIIRTPILVFAHEEVATNHQKLAIFLDV